MADRCFTCVAGQDATTVFYSLHRQEVLQKPGYARLQIGVIEGEKPEVAPLQPGELSQVPYGEPSWLTKGFQSPYFKEVSQYNEIIRLQWTDSCFAARAIETSSSQFGSSLMRFSVRCNYPEQVSDCSLTACALSIDPDAQAREADGKRISQSVVDAMAAKNLNAMRLGPGKHLQGLTLFDGVVKPEEVCLSSRPL